MLILGIETSCDDTACAVLDGEGRVLASVVSSQLAHQPYGGVVPEIASREHLTNWPAVSGEALRRAGATLQDVEVIAATRGPGLIGALLVGLSLGKSIAYALGRPFHAVHHLEGHLFSPFLRTDGSPAEPLPETLTGLVLSGGHSALYAVRGIATATLGETRDDALGEVFDKVGKRLGLPFPQGPQVDRLAELGNPAGRPFSIPGCGDGLDFSYSGLKSQALLEVERWERRHGRPVPSLLEEEPELLDLLAGFRAAAIGQVFDRLERLHRRQPIGLLAVSGGAAANRLLRRQLPEWTAERGIELRLVPLAFSGDNAAMIAHAALLRHRRGLADDPLTAEADSRIPLRAVDGAA